jgi:hypothetical protein
LNVDLCDRNAALTRRLSQLGGSLFDLSSYPPLFGSKPHVIPLAVPPHPHADGAATRHFNIERDHPSPLGIPPDSDCLHHALGNLLDVAPSDVCCLRWHCRAPRRLCLSLHRTRTDRSR